MSFPSNHRPFWHRLSIRRAEIGILLIVFSNLPFLGLPFVGFLLFIIPWVIYSFVGTNVQYILCALTIIGLVLLMSDRKGFLQRVKGNKLVAVLLLIFGLILIGTSFIMIITSNAMWNYDRGKIPEQPPTSEELASHLISQVWAGLASISGISWFFYGLMIWRYKNYLQPLKHEDKQQKIT